MGNKEACKILAKQLIQLRKQKTRTYQASAQISSIGSKQKIMHANQKVSRTDKLSLVEYFFSDGDLNG